MHVYKSAVTAAGLLAELTKNGIKTSDAFSDAEETTKRRNEDERNAYGGGRGRRKASATARGACR